MSGKPAALAIVSVFAIGCNAVYTPTAPDNNWAVHDTPRFSLYVRPGSFCETQTRLIEQAMEDQYDFAIAVLGLRGAVRISMFLYNSGAEISPPLPSPRSGVAFPDTRAVHAICAPPPDDGLVSLLSHEANHVILQQGLGAAGTSFMNEGLASALISERFRPIGPTFLHQWARANRSMLLPVTSLVDDDRWNSNSTAGYRTSASFLAWVLARYGRDRLLAWYPVESSDIMRRTRDIYGRTLGELEAEWLTFLGS